MALTEAGLCNLALSKIGERQFIDDLNENTPSAMVCKVLYPQARDSLLERYWWSFATRRADLALTAEERVGWAYVYTAPADLLVPRFIYPAASRIAFASELNDAATGMVILTDAETPEMSYTFKLTKTVLMSALFQEALSWELAARLALALPIKAAVGLRMDEKFTASLRTAIAADMRKAQEPRQPDSELITERY